MCLYSINSLIASVYEANYAGMEAVLILRGNERDVSLYKHEFNFTVGQEIQPASLNCPA